jgi:hypothetical protein
MSKFKGSFIAGLAKVAAVAALSAFIVIGCGDKDDDGGGINKNHLYCNAGEAWESSNTPNWNSIRSNGTCQIVRPCDGNDKAGIPLIEGTWTIDGNQMKVTLGSTVQTIVISELTATTFTGNIDGQPMTATKRTGLTIVDSCD